MPLYEYQCQSCGERTEVIQSMSDAPLTECPKCGGALKKLLSAPAIQFKGSGFYKTDYASSTGSSTTTPTPAASSSETSSTTTAAAPAAPKSDTKSSD